MTRMVVPTLRNGEVAVGVAASAAVTASFYIPLNRLMSGPDLPMSSYAQYLMPLIALQAIAFASVSTAFRAATDAVHGLNRRLQALPIASLISMAPTDNKPCRSFDKFLKELDLLSTRIMADE